MIQHYPYYKEIMFTALGSIAILYTFRFKYKEVKHWVDYSKLAFVYTYILNFVFRTCHFPYQKITSGLVTLSFFVMLGFIIFQISKSKDKKARKFSIISSVLLIFSMFFAGVGLYLKLIHFPGAH